MAHSQGHFSLEGGHAGRPRRPLPPRESHAPRRTGPLQAQAMLWRYSVDRRAACRPNSRGNQRTWCLPAFAASNPKCTRTGQNVLQSILQNTEYEVVRVCVSLALTERPLPLSRCQSGVQQKQGILCAKNPSRQHGTAEQVTRRDPEKVLRLK